MTQVYVISAGELCHKIGISKRPAGRMQTLQVKAKTKLSLAATFAHDRARDVEFTAHNMLSQSCIRGEWFAVTSEEAIQTVQMAIAHVDADKPIPYRVVVKRSKRRTSDARWRNYLTAEEAARMDEIERELAEIAGYVAQRQVIANRAAQRARYDEKRGDQTERRERKRGES